MSAQIKTIKQGTLRVNGLPTLGIVQNVTLPTLEAKVDPHEAVGMFTAVAFTSGIEPMTFSGNVHAADATLMAALSDMVTEQSFVVMAAQEVRTATGNSVENVIVRVQGRVSKAPGLEITQNTPATGEFEVQVSSYELEVAGSVIVSVNATANVYVTAGVDRLAAIRTALGL